MTTSKVIRKLSVGILLFAVFIGGANAISSNNNAAAAPVVGFNPGYIISDNIFTNNQSMTTSQIQSFLESKVLVCDTWGTGGSTTTSRRDFIRSYGYDVPLKCLIDYKENNKSAAQIIYDTAQKYKINPQVLIVLLQKEQALVTDDWPGPWQYKTATGYGCPDTAACDSQYFGLTNQLDWAGKMFRAIMDSSPTWYAPYIVGNNYIRYNPVASCGGSTVNIQNKATAALYNYTPYQPNQSALNAGYGSGDSCGAYGNRNFYQYFSDWFGSPTYGNFVRTSDNATVYLVSGNNKYAVPSMDMITALYQLGGVTTVKSTYLSSKTTGSNLGRVIKSGGGTIYFYDAGIKLAFGSCGLVEAYGSSCSAAIALDEYQINILSNGPNMTRVLKTTSGKTFYMDGTKREIFDETSLVSNGFSTSSNTLNESSLSSLIYGAPVLRDDVVVASREGDQRYLSQSGTLISIPNDVSKFGYLESLSTKSLDEKSIQLGLTGGGFTGFARSAAGDKYLLNSSGKFRLSNPTNWSSGFTLLTNTMLNSIPDNRQSVDDGFIKVNGDSSIYMVIDAEKYPIGGWNDFVNLHSDKSTGWTAVSKSTLESIPTASTIYAPGSLLKTSTSATVYVINGLLHKSALPSFLIRDDLGLGTVKVIAQKELDGFFLDAAPISNFVSCGSDVYLANKGTLYLVDAATSTDYGYDTSVAGVWDDLGCSILQYSISPLSQFKFIKSESSKTIYYIDSGKKRPISSIATFSGLGGTAKNTLIMSNANLERISEGSLI